MFVRLHWRVWAPAAAAARRQMSAARRDWSCRHRLGWAGLGWLGWAGGWAGLGWAGQHSAGSLNGNVSNSAAGWPPSALHWTPATSPGCRVNAELLQLNKYTKPRMIAPCEISMQTAHSARIIFSDSTGLLQLYLMWNCGIKIFLSDTFFL